MSSSYVRNKVRQWCAAAAASTGIPFHDTVNVSVNPTDPVWFTVAFVSESHEGTFCKPDFIENGFISVVFFALPGTGDTACINAVEAVIPVLFANLDPKLALINYDPVDEDSLGSADKDYRMSVSVNYRLSL
jgi:hypothetical protein